MSKHIDKIRIDRPISARQQVATLVRELVVSGKIKPGEKLPSTQELSTQLGVARSSVHVALTMLTKEGLLERTRKLGTFVSQRDPKLTCVGIYLWEDIWRMPTAAFRRHLVGTLIELLQAQGVKAEIWMYPQYQEERITPWPELVQAVNERRIQAILMPDSTSADRSWINRLKIPSVEYTPDVIRNRITIEPGAAERLAVQELARMGCKSVGMISPYSQSWLDAHDDSYEWVQADRAFSDAVKKQGLVLHEPWISHPLTVPASDIWESDSERYGYEAMSRLLAMTQRPDGIFVQHDLVARGALSAVLRSKIAVPEELKLVLYRNAEIGLSCPVPAAFVDLSITEVAQAIINVLYARLRGEEVTVVKVSPKLTPLTDYKLQNNQTTLVKRGVSQLLNETV